MVGFSRKFRISVDNVLMLGHGAISIRAFLTVYTRIFMAKSNALVAAKANVEPKYLTPHEAAVTANVSIWFIRKLLAQKMWPVTRLGSAIRISRVDFEKWLAANTEPANDQVVA